MARSVWSRRTCSSSLGRGVLWRTIAWGGEEMRDPGRHHLGGGGIDAAVSDERLRRPPGVRELIWWQRGLVVGGCLLWLPPQPHPRGGGSHRYNIYTPMSPWHCLVALSAMLRWCRSQMDIWTLYLFDIRDVVAVLSETSIGLLT